jgi:trehalose synthase
VVLKDVDVAPVSLERFNGVATSERWRELQRTAQRARQLLEGRRVWNVNSTATGGGVAEMLEVLVAYGLDAGVDIRWTVIEGDAQFFAITKRLHNLLHGAPGDGLPLGADEARHYDDVLSRNLEAFSPRIRPGDLVILHDPQTAGLIRGLRDMGATVIWRCHIGADRPNDHVTRAWAFLRAHLAPHQFVFSRPAFVPDWAREELVSVIPPSIDPFSAKNQDLTDDVVKSILVRAGVVEGTIDAEPRFIRRDGSTGRVERQCSIVRADGALGFDTPLTIQVSRWDRLKDMIGVLRAFADHVEDDEVSLALVGPEVSRVVDDPEGQAVLQECIEAWRRLPADRRERVHLVSVPMDDVEENAAIVNALQRHAAVVLQKSLAEGFGLTVSEAMWKQRPVVASAVGGIQDQIVDGEHGVLLGDPADLRACAAAVDGLLRSPERRAQLGRNAKERVAQEFLGDRHLIQWTELFDRLI